MGLEIDMYIDIDSEVGKMIVYKIPYRRPRAWPSARASKGILHTSKMIINKIPYRRAGPVQPLGRVRARAKVSCNQVKR